VRGGIPRTSGRRVSLSPVQTMDDVPFIFTYPNFFPLSPAGAPELIQVDGHLCICFFTDADNVRRFQTAQHGEKFAVWTARAIVSESRERLLSNMKTLRPDLDEQGVTHVAIDPLPGPRKKIIYTSLDEFTAEV
jgi:hypothetical protein